MITTADFDGNGMLESDEFLRLMINEKKVFLKDAFLLADVGGKGFLTEGEVFNCLTSAGFEDSAHRLIGALEAGRMEGSPTLNYS